MLFDAPVLLFPVLLALLTPLVNDLTVAVLAVLGLLLVVAGWSSLLPQRGLPDRSSGTYPVPK